MENHARLVGILLLSVALVGAGSAAPNRPVHEWGAVRLSLLTWANGVVNADSAEVATVLHETFPNRDRYLQRVARTAFGYNQVVIRCADYETVDDSVRVTPVVIFRDRGTSKRPFTLTLIKEGNVWQITSMTRAPELPKELIATALPEYSILHAIPVTVRDADTGEPIVTRVHVKDREGEYWPPDGHMKNIPTGWRQDVGGNVKLDGKTYAYVEPEFTLSVPEGSYEMEVVRGLEYEPQTVRFEVTKSELPTLSVSLKRWSNVQEQGWYSGDTHVHFLDPRTALLELRGEDLNVVNILATKWGELITNVEHFIGAPSPLSGPDQIVYVNEETRHGFLGHTVLLNLKQLVYPLTWGGPGAGVPGGYDYPPMAHQADKAHRQGGFVSWAHFPGPFGELAVDIALGKIDAIDLMTWGNAFRESGRAPPARTWYRFLNVGFKVPATAGTDKMINTQVVGSVRTYVKVEGPFTYEGWLDGVRAGRTFATTGPMLTFTADGRGLGETIEAEAGDEIAVRVEVRSRLPVERIEIIQGGEVVAVKENVEGVQELTLQTEVTVDESSWFAARTYSSEQLPYNGVPVMAHTSPIYIDVDGRARRSPEDAAFLAGWTDRAIEWAQTEAKFQYEAQRDEMIALFERAKAVYLEQMPPGTQP